MKNWLQLFCAVLSLCVFVSAPANAAHTDLELYTYGFCVGAGDLNGPPAWATVRKLIKPMEKDAAKIGHSVEDFFLNPACEPRYIGGVLAPYLHLMSENTTDLLVYLVEIKKYFVETRKRPDLWRAMVLSKNTRGMTVLDYLEYKIINQKGIEEEAEGISRFIDFICAEGGSYAVFPKSCPKSPEDSATRIVERLNTWDKPGIAAAHALVMRQPDTRKPEDR